MTELLPGLTTDVDILVFGQYVVGAFAAYWSIFLLTYFLPINPGDAKPLNPKTTCRRSIAFANRCAAISHAIAEMVIATYMIHKYFRYDSTRLFLPINWDAPLQGDAHYICALVVGYCFADGLYLVLFEYDFLMFAHHVAVVIGILPCQLAPYGFLIATTSTWVAEVTNPVQNVWQYGRDFGPKQMYQAMSGLFTYSFAICRGIIMPVLLLDYYVFLFLEVREGLGMWLWLLRLSVIIFTIGWFGSLMWLKGVILGYWRYLEKKKAKKEKA
mmetsp:Transcript_23980/g.29005  ORF Transcript_23980/g.29005 Transcript_23980/m.29005 type:complete len:271 (+) Transcript_23980:110-922(+)|eukprot:CAMPEP_0197864696 /NCGR_PEP_ID=MMETSP1438-20131217/43146_1 /TAXON_ID=1461541 /ORGANISM="Pterosperma sp., Strain CCMP1384" /LENGTH=270 /DNA_ID=CAMNT_0043483043 /DNA_START=109 /DNA_END=921 /DNA_ORIENTATION=+